ncbi:MAG: Hpt domain-containing protein [Calothrix sp. MO_167.B12]|nr:Hpt domain-containing protein [Calothrix sp. MO_167.B12]
MMLPETEREIRIEFLGTATEYLNNLEKILLGINDDVGAIPDKINVILRILHFLQDSGGMPEFRMLGDLAYRLEDAFQVLKGRKYQQKIDSDLHNLLLSTLDWLRHILELIAAKSLIDEHWLATFCYPLFEELYKGLDQPDPEDIASIVTPKKTSQNIIHLVFKTEVEKSLQSLDNLLFNYDGSLLQKMAIATATELAGLGEMLDMPVFTQICQSIRQQLILASSEESVIDTTHLALEAWRRSQLLILNQRSGELPSVIHQYFHLSKIRV